MNLLIVDDDAVNRKLLRAQLEAEGHGVLDATNGVEALKVLDQKRVDGVVSDILMPDMDGFQLCLEIRKSERISGLPFIFYTSTYSSAQDQQLAKTVGADDYLSKPSPTPVILGALHEAARRTRQRMAGAAAQYDETYILKQYNSALVRKLEQRNIELEEALRQLQSAHRETRESEARLNEAQRNARIGSWRYQPDGKLAWSDQMFDLFPLPRGLPPTYEAMLAAIHPEDLGGSYNYAFMSALKSGAREFEAEYRVVWPDGRVLTVLSLGKIHRDAEGRVIEAVGTVQDITARKAGEEKIRRLSRVHAVLSGINSVIVHKHNRQELFEEACRIAVEHGGFGIAWIGSYDQETSGVKPLAWAGIDAELLVTGSGSDGGIQQARGVLARAFREHRPAIENDIMAKPEEGGPRRKEAIRRGYRSVITLPMIVEGEIVGNFSLFAKEPDFFDDDEVRLLTELAGDISFALQYIAKEEKVNYLAYYDALTGLPNRTLFLEHLSHSLHSTEPPSGQLVLVLGDIKRFRLINDTLGRHSGDDLLKQVAKRLRQLVRNPENLARVSGNCFATFLPEINDLAEVAHRLENLMGEAVRNPVRVAGQDLNIAFTLGASVFPQDGTDAETLFRNAEAALVKAKTAGTTYQFYEPALNARVAETLKLENKLRKALELDHFVLFYQPKVDVLDRNMTGLEALIRWKDPELGLVPPVKFIELMEETGLILDVGKWALGRAARDWGNWARKGLRPPRVAINVSPLQLRQKDFVDTVVQTVDAFGGPEVPLDLEITESMVMENVQETTKKLQIVRGLGVEIAIDDFGTGYSSLGYVAKLPVNALKIDRSFIIEMGKSEYCRNIVTMVISLAHTLHLKVIAEGVDDEEHVRILRELGCDEMQGYLISKPAPPEEIETLLQRRTAK